MVIWSAQHGAQEAAAKLHTADLLQRTQQPTLRLVLLHHRLRKCRPLPLPLSSQKNFLVPVGDAAADSAAEFSTSTRITVKMTFPTQVVTVDPSDARASYAASAGAPFSVDDTGLITANSIGETGSGTVFVSFRGQSVNATVGVTVAKYHRLETVARPYPSYSGSDNVIVSTLAPIECTVPTHYQQAKLKSTMVLTNDAEATIRSNRVAPPFFDFGVGIGSHRFLLLPPLSVLRW